MKQILLIACIAISTGIAPARSQGTDPGGTPDHELGLSQSSVFDVVSPEAFVEEQSDPGELGVVPRANEESPPVIPHGIADFLPITMDSNLCVDCHAVDEKIEGEPTPIPPSHYTDYRSGLDEAGENLVGARYVCVSCHVTRTQADPLVGNSSSLVAPRADRP